MIFDLQPTLENNLILLRPLNQEDYDSLYQVAKDPLIWEQHPCDRSEKNEFGIFFKESMASKGALLIINKLSNEVIGSSRFNEIEGVNSAIEIGWSFLARKYWGGKFNKEIKNLMIDYAFKYIDDLIFRIDKDNIRSQKAVEKISGEKITRSDYRHLIKENDTNLTFLINKKNWRN